MPPLPPSEIGFAGREPSLCLGNLVETQAGISGKEVRDIRLSLSFLLRFDGQVALEDGEFPLLCFGDARRFRAVTLLSGLLRRLQRDGSLKDSRTPSWIGTPGEATIRSPSSATR